MLGRTMFDIIWVNFAKNQEEKPGKSLPRILASHWRKHRQNKKILFPRKHSFELWLKSTNYTGRKDERKNEIKGKLTFWFVKTKPK